MFQPPHLVTARDVILVRSCGKYYYEVSIVSFCSIAPNMDEPWSYSCQDHMSKQDQINTLSEVTNPYHLRTQVISTLKRIVGLSHHREYVINHVRILELAQNRKMIYPTELTAIFLDQTHSQEQNADP